MCEFSPDCCFAADSGALANLFARREIFGPSDHVPVVLELTGEL